LGIFYHCSPLEFANLSADALATLYRATVERMQMTRPLTGGDDGR
jgi:hypothetical protein